MYGRMSHLYQLRSQFGYILTAVHGVVTSAWLYLGSSPHPNGAGAGGEEDISLLAWGIALLEICPLDGLSRLLDGRSY